MNLKQYLLEKQSKSRVIDMLDYIGSDKKKFGQLMDLFLNGDNRMAQNASWVVSHVADKYPKLMHPYIDDFIDIIQRPVHNAVKRNVVRILADQDIQEKHLGAIAEICFNFVNDVKEAIAVRAFSLTVLYNICLKEPELASELKITIEEFLPHSTAAFKSRGNKILKKIENNFPV